MLENMINDYINKLTINDFIDASLKYNISLNNNEINILYNCIKKDWKTLIYGNPNEILSDLKQSINNESYNKLLNYYYDYKERYKNYL